MAWGSEEKKAAEGGMKGKRTQGVSMEAQAGSRRRRLDTGDVLFAVWLEVRKEGAGCTHVEHEHGRMLKQKKLQSGINRT